jgi:hypothetical protein
VPATRTRDCSCNMGQKPSSSAERDNELKQPPCPEVPGMNMKLLLVGSTGANKTGMFHRFCDGTYSPMYPSTIGVDFKIKNLILDGLKIKLQVMIANNDLKCVLCLMHRKDLGYSRPRKISINRRGPLSRHARGVIVL